MSYKSISLRLNMQDRVEKELYDKVESSAKAYTSTASFLKYVLTTYYEQEQTEDILVLIKEEMNDYQNSLQRTISDEITRQGSLILSSLVVDVGRDFTTLGMKNENNLPDKSDVIPEELGKVLSMFG